MDCPSGKIPYKNATAAHAKNQHFRKGGKRKVYQCEHCHQWHLAHGTPTKPKPAVKRRYLERESE